MDVGIVCQDASTGGWRYTLMLACALKRMVSESRITVYCCMQRLPRGGFDTLTTAGVELTPLWDSKWLSPFKPKQLVGLKLIDKGLNALRRRWNETVQDDYYRKITKRFARHDVMHFAWPYGLEPPLLTVPMSFIPHDFIYTHDFGVDQYTQQAWIAARQSHERWLASATPIVSSEFIAHELRQSFPSYAGPVDVVYLSSLHPTSTAGNDPSAVAEVRGRYGLPNRYILCPNNIMPHKNLSGILAALWHMRQAGADVKLILCGQNTDSIRAVVRSPLYADRSDFESTWDVLGLGIVSDADLLALMGGALLVVNPSLCEAGSGSGLDAWGNGCPVALSDIPAFRDQVRFLGTRAEFFDPQDPREIARVLLGMLATPDRVARAVEASREAIARYSWDDVATGYFAIFERMLESSQVERR